MKHGLQLVTAPTVDPVSIAEARAQCRIDSTTEDGLIADYILAARAYVEVTTGLSLISQTYDMTLSHWPHSGNGILLPRNPVQSITSVKYYDTTNALQTLSSSYYEIDVSRNPTAIHLADGYEWPDTYDRISPIVVRFVAGYGSAPGSVPEPIRQAIKLLVGGYYANRESAILSPGMGVAMVPFGVEALLQPYKVYGF
jgi:uncharacterized phiE125 gp8 family phage protein